VRFENDVDVLSLQECVVILSTVEHEFREVRRVGLVTGGVKVIAIFTLIPDVSHESFEFWERASNTTAIESKGLTIENSSDSKAVFGRRSSQTIVIIS
jgi:hypothetical protein